MVLEVALVLLGLSWCFELTGAALCIAGVLHGHILLDVQHFVDGTWVREKWHVVGAGAAGLSNCQKMTEARHDASDLDNSKEGNFKVAQSTDMDKEAWRRRDEKSE